MPTILPRVMLSVAALLSVAAAPAAVPVWAGVWRNTNNTVHIKAAPCGEDMCGTVVWANDKTKADVAAKGRNIIGMQIFRNFQKTSDREWRGKVYVPDVGMTVTGTIKLSDTDNLTATGCFFLGLGCQTRHWSRIS